MSDGQLIDPEYWRKRGYRVKINPDGSYTLELDPDYKPPPPKPRPKPLPEAPWGPWVSAAGSGDGRGPGAGGSMSAPGGDFGDAGEGGDPPPRRDPLILDLDGDGIETTNVRGRAFFDHDMDGFAEQTGWVTPDDGLLVMDRNGDGVINDGTELFGSHTLARDGSTAANGFQVLPDLDSNHDGKIDATDSAFSQLRVWQDSDGDGYSRPDELFNLDQLGITAINLDSAITNSTDAQGNTRTRTGTFEKADGTTGQIGEYNLQSDATYNIPTEWLNVPQDIAALPDLRGYGTVHDLHQAMVRDTTGQLKSIVEQFMI